MVRTVEEFKKEVAKVMATNPHLRYGQAVFNLMHDLYPDEANSAVGTDRDPFYRDERAEAFITTCLEVD